CAAGGQDGWPGECRSAGLHALVGAKDTVVDRPCRCVHRPAHPRRHRPPAAGRNPLRHRPARAVARHELMPPFPIVSCALYPALAPCDCRDDNDTIMLRHRLPLLIFAMLTLLVVAGDLFACPNCKDVLPSAEDGTQRGAVAEGFYYSILFMMSTPFLLAGTF